MKTVDLSKVPEFLQRQRWFGGKAWPIKRVEVLDHATIELPGRQLAPDLAVVEVSYEGPVSSERYLMPVTCDRNGELGEALEDDELARMLLRIALEERKLTTTAGSLRGERMGPPSLLELLRSPPRVRRMSVEQSNTSFVFEDLVILKVIRRFEAGENPELEIGRFLARRGFLATPPLLAAISLESNVGSTVAVVHAFIRDAGDGWSWTLEAFKSGRVDAAFLASIRELGLRVGELHVALASDDADPAFRPEPIETADLQRWSSSLVGEMGVTLAQCASIDEGLFRRRQKLVERIQHLGHLEPGGKKIRVHGDLHLGQVLRQGDRWLIFDFEGEPARSYAQRREKFNPMKDVAGMLRSFSYAEGVARKQGGPGGDFIIPVRQAFLEGYLTAASPAGFLPRNPDTLEGMLEAMELEKLLYEIRYELSNRPDWVHIPLSTLTRIEAQL